MKVLIVSTVSFRLNGITSVIMNYYRKMDKSNMETDFLVIDGVDEKYEIELKKNKDTIYNIPRKKNPIKYIIKLSNLLKNNNYDLIHIHGNSATMAIETTIAYFMKVPIRIIHSHNTTCKHKILHVVLYPILKKTYTHGFACGEDAGKWLFRDDKFEVIKNGVDLKRFKYDEANRRIYREKINAKNKKVLGHIGNFNYQKNHDFLINSFSELIKKDNNYLLLLIGEGELLNEMKEKVKKLEITDNVVFLGKTTKIIEYLHAMDIFLLPSHYEGLPVVLIEAQALGLKCLVSDKVSNEVKLTNLVRFLTINNTSVWVEKIISIKNDNRINDISDAYTKLDKCGYNISKNASKIKTLYQKYLESSRK